MLEMDAVYSFTKYFFTIFCSLGSVVGDRDTDGSKIIHVLKSIIIYTWREK